MEFNDFTQNSLNSQVNKSTVQSLDGQSFSVSGHNFLITKMM